MSSQGEFLIVEDDVAMARTLERVFGRYRPVRLAQTACQAFAALEEVSAYTGAVIDVGLPDFSGLEVLDFLRARSPLLPALILTARFDRDVANRAQAMHAECVFKPASIENFVGFIYRALASDAVADERVALALDEVVRRHGLAPRERQILTLAVADVPRAAIASWLGIRENTLKTWVGSLLKKSSAQNLAELVQSVLRNALEPDQESGLLP